MVVAHANAEREQSLGLFCSVSPQRFGHPSGNRDAAAGPRRLGRRIDELAIDAPTLDASHEVI
jgi:hypothetical protein